MFLKKGEHRKRVRWNRRLTHLCTFCIGVSRKFHLHFTLYTYVLSKRFQDGAKFKQKLTPGFKNHMKNLDNFRKAVESPKSWNPMGYVCQKSTFLQLKHYIQRIYLTLLSTNCMKIHQIHYVFLKPKGQKTIRHNSSVFFQLKHYILFTKVAWSANFQTFHCSR